MRCVRALYAPYGYAVPNAGVCVLNRLHKKLRGTRFWGGISPITGAHHNQSGVRRKQIQVNIEGLSE